MSMAVTGKLPVLLMIVRVRAAQKAGRQAGRQASSTLFLCVVASLNPEGR